MLALRVLLVVALLAVVPAASAGTSVTCAVSTSSPDNGRTSAHSARCDAAGVVGVGAPDPAARVAYLGISAAHTAAVAHGACPPQGACSPVDGVVVQREDRAAYNHTYIGHVTIVK